jgi:predicted nucleotide-binding protein (sugar kinase/HSP70/actin superfamily)
MNYDTEAYEEAVNKWYEELKDIVASDLLRQHISKYPEKKDFEIKEKDDKISDSNEQPTVDK